MLLVNSIRTIANGLKPLDEKFVFVGGSVVECYVTSSVAEQARPTDDIDVVSELAHYGEYATLQEKLLAAGFNPDHESKVICRYKYKGIIVDIMPDNAGIIGFTNRWYKEGIKNAVLYRIDESLEIRIFSSPFYVASKIQAYLQRGARDKRLSTDFEDIIYVVENRKELIEEVNSSHDPVKEFLVAFFTNLLNEKNTEEAISAVIGYSPLPGRIAYVKNTLIKLSKL